MFKKKPPAPGKENAPSPISTSGGLFTGNVSLPKVNIDFGLQSSFQQSFQTHAPQPSPQHAFPQQMPIEEPLTSHSGFQEDARFAETIASPQAAIWETPPVEQFAWPAQENRYAPGSPEAEQLSTMMNPQADSGSPFSNPQLSQATDWQQPDTTWAEEFSLPEQHFIAAGTASQEPVAVFEQTPEETLYSSPISPFDTLDFPPTEGAFDTPTALFSEDIGDDGSQLNDAGFLNAQPQSPAIPHQALSVDPTMQESTWPGFSQISAETAQTAAMDLFAPPSMEELEQESEQAWQIDPFDSDDTLEQTFLLSEDNVEIASTESPPPAPNETSLWDRPVLDWNNQAGTSNQDFINQPQSEFDGSYTDFSSPPTAEATDSEALFAEPSSFNVPSINTFSLDNTAALSPPQESFFLPQAAEPFSSSRQPVSFPYSFDEEQLAIQADAESYHTSLNSEGMGAVSPNFDTPFQEPTLADSEDAFVLESEPLPVYASPSIPSNFPTWEPSQAQGSTQASFENLSYEDKPLADSSVDLRLHGALDSGFSSLPATTAQIIEQQTQTVPDFPAAEFPSTEFSAPNFHSPNPQFPQAVLPSDWEQVDAAFADSNTSFEAGEASNNWPLPGIDSTLILPAIQDINPDYSNSLKSQSFAPAFAHQALNGLPQFQAEPAIDISNETVLEETPPPVAPNTIHDQGNDSFLLELENGPLFETTEENTPQDFWHNISQTSQPYEGLQSFGDNGLLTANTPGHQVATHQASKGQFLDSVHTTIYPHHALEVAGADFESAAASLFPETAASAPPDFNPGISSFNIPPLSPSQFQSFIEPPVVSSAPAFADNSLNTADSWFGEEESHQDSLMSIDPINANEDKSTGPADPLPHMLNIPNAAGQFDFFLEEQAAFEVDDAWDEPWDAAGPEILSIQIPQPSLQHPDNMDLGSKALENTVLLQPIEKNVSEKNLKDPEEDETQWDLDWDLNEQDIKAINQPSIQQKTAAPLHTGLDDVLMPTLSRSLIEDQWQFSEGQTTEPDFLLPVAPIMAQPNQSSQEKLPVIIENKIPGAETSSAIKQQPASLLLTPKTEPPQVIKPLQPTEALVHQEPEPDGLHILQSLEMTPFHRLLLVKHADMFALMGQVGPEEDANVTVIKLFPTNPLLISPEFVAFKEGQAAHKEMFVVQLGKWRAVVSVDTERIQLHTEF